MEALSLDLRERVAAAWDEGGRSQPEIAEDFGVSLSFVTKLLARRRLTGSVAAKPHAGGFASAVDTKAEAALRSLVAERPDATLAELADGLADGLAERRGVRRSAPVICRAVRRLGLPRKKRRSTPPSATRRGSAASAGRSAGSSSGCPPQAGARPLVRGGRRVRHHDVDDPHTRPGPARRAGARRGAAGALAGQDAGGGGPPG